MVYVLTSNKLRHSHNNDIAQLAKKRLQDVFKTFSKTMKTFFWRRFQNVILYALNNVLKTLLDNVKWVYLGCIQNVFKQA